MGEPGQYRALVRAFGVLRLAAAALALAAGPAAADCRLALALGIDVSRSVSRLDYEVQRQGLMAALTAPEIRAAFLQPGGFVALALYEWSGRRHQELVVPWVAVQSEADLDAVVAKVAGRERYDLHLPTGLGEALSYGRELFGTVGFCASYTLDISGDGQNNDGRHPARVYEAEDFSGILVNGLPIGGHEADITDYYRKNVIRGPGAFVEPAPSQEDFPRAIRRKLERELTRQLLGNLGRTGGRG